MTWGLQIAAMEFIFNVPILIFSSYFVFNSFNFESSSVSFEIVVSSFREIPLTSSIAKFWFVIPLFALET